MVYAWLDVAIAATICSASIAAAFALDAWQRRHRLRTRAQLRAAGAGPYLPTHALPRDIDLALEIADHLRLKYAPLVKLGAAINEAMRVSLRAATILARTFPLPPTS